MKTRYLLLFSLLVSGVGCKKMSASDVPGHYGYDDRADAAADDMEPMADYEGSYSEAEAMPATVAMPTRDFAAPAPQAEPSDRTTASDGAAPVPAVADDHPANVGRQIIYTAGLGVSVFNVVEAMEQAEALPEKYGGYVANMTTNALELKIPSKNLRPAMDELGSMGVVEYRSLQSTDVSDQYYDLETRIAVLERTQLQMMELLSKARTVQEALEVRKALDEITMQLEVFKGQMRKLKNHVAFSTLSVSLSERGPHDPTPSSNDPFPWVDDLGVEATEWR